MKDIKTALVISLLLAVMFQVSMECSYFENYWAVVNPSIIAILSCIILTKTQIGTQESFLKHLGKTFKINVLILAFYIPICLILNVRWSVSLQNSISKFMASVPEVLASSLTAGLILLILSIPISIISYFAGKLTKT